MESLQVLELLSLQRDGSRTSDAVDDDLNGDMLVLGTNKASVSVATFVGTYLGQSIV